jgi:exopolysaccharide biosynthesis polyprenyl glycosylphosphotransferase
VSDLIAFALGLVLGLFIGQSSRAPEQLLWCIPLLPAWALLMKTYGLYDHDARRVSHSTVDDLPGIFHALLVTALGTWAWAKYLPPEKMTLFQAFLFVSITFVAVVAGRVAVRRLLRHVLDRERVLFVGEESATDLLVSKVRLHPEYGLEPVGYVTGRGATAIQDDQLPWLGAADELVAVCARERIDRVIVATLTIQGEALANLVRDAHEAGVKVSVLPHAFDVVGPAAELDDVEGITVLALRPPALARSSWALKRAMDLAIALPLMILLLPLVPIVALLVKLDSRGPVFFAHERVGRGGKLFRLEKVRGRGADAADQADSLREQSAHSAWLLLDEDPRVTRVGRFLRTASIDELPQLWNVLRGEMSLVGPRPMPPDIHEHIPGWGRRRIDLTPGLTGLWQVLGRTAIPFEEMIKLDYLYVTNWSLWGDVRLLLKTIYVVVSRRGAN